MDHSGANRAAANPSPATLLRRDPADRRDPRRRASWRSVPNADAMASDKMTGPVAMRGDITPPGTAAMVDFDDIAGRNCLLLPAAKGHRLGRSGKSSNRDDTKEKHCCSAQNFLLLPEFPG